MHITDMTEGNCYYYCLKIFQAIEKLQVWASDAVQVLPPYSPSDSVASRGKISNNSNKTSYIFIEPHNLYST